MRITNKRGKEKRVNNLSVVTWGKSTVTGEKKKMVTEVW